MIDYSVIIPQRNSLETLPRLFKSIPQRDNVEIILVDNTPTPITKADILIDRDYKLCWSHPDRCAGGARNVGIENAIGKWLIFSDADDFFAEEAFDVFESIKDSDADIIYFCAQGIYPDTGLSSNQADLYTNLVRSYLQDSKNEMSLRLSFHVPWAKMVKRSFVEKMGLRFDEVVANNDDYFALTAGYYANKVHAVNKTVYYYAVSCGSIMRRRSLDVMKTRFEVILRCNQFKRQHGLSNYQGSVMYFLAQSRHYGFIAMLQFFGLLFKYKQNPFVGYRNWIKTSKKIRQQEQKDKKYITQ